MGGQTVGGAPVSAADPLQTVLIRQRECPESRSDIHNPKGIFRGEPKEREVVPRNERVGMKRESRPAEATRHPRVPALPTFVCPRMVSLRQTGVQEVGLRFKGSASNRFCPPPAAAWHRHWKRPKLDVALR